MRYMLLIYGDAEVWKSASPEENQAIFQEYGTYTQEIIDSGEYVSGDPLQGHDTATTVRIRDGKRLLTDGPFAETKEHLGGYYLVDVKDLDRAIELAARIPGAAHGYDSIEVRPVMELPPDMPGQASR